MHLYDRANHKPSQLSGGEQQRVAVARALINSPSIILADEPSGNLDSRNAKELHEYFFKLRETYKQTFLIVTHSEELAKMSDRMIEMQDGKINKLWLKHFSIKQQKQLCFRLKCGIIYIRKNLLQI